MHVSKNSHMAWMLIKGMSSLENCIQLALCFEKIKIPLRSVSFTFCHIQDSIDEGTYTTIVS